MLVSLREQFPTAGRTSTSATLENSTAAATHGPGNIPSVGYGHGHGHGGSFATEEGRRRRRKGATGTGRASEGD